MAAMNNYKEAMLKRDGAALEKLFHPDLTYSHSSGKLESKTEAIVAASKGPTYPESIEMGDMKVRVYGNTALVRGNMDFNNKSASGTNLIKLNVLTVWLKTPQGWQLVARQSTRLNP